MRLILTPFFRIIEFIILIPIAGMVFLLLAPVVYIQTKIGIVSLSEIIQEELRDGNEHDDFVIENHKFH